MNELDIDLNLLRALNAILTDDRVSGAARRLGLSQPATSAALSRLRKLLNDPLLVRRGNTMVRTPLAEELRPRVTHLLGQIMETMRPPKVFQAINSHRRFRIMADEYASLVLLAPLARRLREKGPGITLDVQVFDSRYEEKLAVQDCDLVLTQHDLLCSSPHASLILTDRFVAIVRAGHPRISDHLSVEAFFQEAQVITSSMTVSRAIADVAVSVNKEWRPAVVVPQFLTLPSIVAGTDMIGLVPRFVAETFRTPWQLTVLDSSIEFDKFEVGCAAHMRSTSDQAILWLQGEIRDIANKMSTSCKHLFGS